MTHWRSSQKQYKFRASAQKLSAVPLLHFLLLPIKLTHLNHPLTAQHQSEKLHTDTVTEQYLCWIRWEIHVWSISSSHLHLWKMRWTPAQHSKHNSATDSYRGRAEVSTTSFTLFLVLPHIWYIFVFWTSSRHLYGVDHHLLLSVSHILASYSCTKMPVSSHYICSESLLEIHAFAHPFTHISALVSLHLVTTIFSR